MTRRKDFVELPMKYKDTIDVQYKLVRDRMALKDLSINTSKSNIINFIINLI